MSNSNSFFSSSGSNIQSFSDTDSMSLGTIIGLTCAAVALVGGVSFAWYLYRRWNRTEVSRVEPAHAHDVAPAQGAITLPIPPAGVQLITIRSIGQGEPLFHVRRYRDGSTYVLPATTPPEVSQNSSENHTPSP